MKAAIAPAQVASLTIDKEKKSIEVNVKEDQLSIAIGKHGQNVRLASKLIGWELDIRPAKEAKEKSASDNILAKQVKLPTKKLASVKSLSGVGKKAEATLLEAGFDTVLKIAATNVNSLVKLEGIGKKTAEKIMASAKEKVDQ